METQDVRLDYKDLVLFPKWRLCIPFILSLVAAFFVPAAGIAIFYGLLRIRIASYGI